jgi:hypothetical protein
MRAGDFSGLDEHGQRLAAEQRGATVHGHRAGIGADATDSAIYQQYNVNGNGQFTPITLCTATVTTNCQASYLPFPGNVIPTNMLDATALKSLKYIACAGTLLSQRQQRHLQHLLAAPAQPGREALHVPRGPGHQRQQPPVRALHRHADRQDPGHAGEPDQQRRTPTAGPSRRCWPTRTRFAHAAQRYPAELHARPLQLDGGSAVGSLHRRQPEYRVRAAQHHQGRLADLQRTVPGIVAGRRRQHGDGLRRRGSTNVEDREERYAITDIVYKSHGA